MRSLLLASLCVSLAAAAAPKAASISMVSSNAIDGELPFSVFSATGWHARATAEYVKVHLYLDDELLVSRVELASCGDPLAGKPTVFTNFDGNIDSLARAKGSPVLALAYAKPQKVRSLTFNLGRNKKVCLRDLKLFDEAGAAYEVKVPRVVKGKITASSTTRPVASYHVLNLFDSRYEYAWASDAATKGVVLDVTFDEPQTVDRLRVWNGYQRSDVHCFSNSRLKAFTLEGDGDYRATATATDAMGSQLVTLPKPFTGKHLKLTVTDAFVGKKYKDLVISELRFGSEAGWLTLDPTAQMAVTAKANRDAFKKAGLLDALDSGLVASEGQSDWTLRLRSDGSLFLEGTSVKEQLGAMRMERSHFYSLGNYEVKAAAEDGLDLRIFGLLKVQSEEIHYSMDCNGCGRDCNQAAGGDGDRIYEELLHLTKGAEGLDVENQSGKHLDFETLSFRREP